MGCSCSSNTTANTQPRRPGSNESGSTASQALPLPTPSHTSGSHNGSAAPEEHAQILADMLIARMLLHEDLEQLQMLSQANRRENTEVKGLTEEEISTIGAVKALETPDGSDDLPSPSVNPIGTECVMCLVDYCAGDTVRVLNCRHVFHTHCIDEWLQRNRTCPCCCRDVTVAVVDITPPPMETKGNPDPLPSSHSDDLLDPVVESFSPPLPGDLVEVV
jgi:hypothetical protein